MEIFYIKEYIDFFEECENLFLKGQIKNQNFEEYDHLNNPKLSPQPPTSIILKSTDKQQSSPINYSIHSRLSSEDSKSPKSSMLKYGILKKKTSKMFFSPKINNSINVDERLSIVMNIFEFHRAHSQGLENLIQKIIRVYNELIIQSNSWSKQYEEIVISVFFVLNKKKIKMEFFRKILR